ncbi:MAG: DUF1080 domain-containing protein [Bacteroidota bacterium]|nr:DUF1080 domain-containing protein [Bacteroidota bacterium]
MKRLLFIFFIICFTMGYAQKPKEQPVNTLTAKEKAQGWHLLFDGKTLNGWKGYNHPAVPKNWSVEDNALTCYGRGGEMGGDIITSDKYENFDLIVEWKISKGSNSGIFYHVIEGSQYTNPYETGPEYQIIDDLGWPDKLAEWQQTGADYALHPADKSQKVLHAVGEWNTSRIVFKKGHVEHWLNGKKIVEFQAWTPEWEQKVLTTKFKDMPQYGRAKTGYIGLQNHGSKVCFRNIKIKKL